VWINPVLYSLQRKKENKVGDMIPPSGESSAILSDEGMLSSSSIERGRKIILQKRQQLAFLP